MKVNASVPVVLPVSTGDKERLAEAESVTLAFHGRSVAVVRRPQFYEHRKEERCSRQFGSADTAHPYIKVGPIMRRSHRHARCVARRRAALVKCFLR